MRRLSEWVDLMEGELPEEEAAELELILRHSVTDRRVFLNMSRMRELIQQTDPIREEKELLYSPDYQKKLQNKIMASLRQEMKASNCSAPNNVLKLLRDSVS